MSYSAEPLRDVLNRFAAGKPVPGGGPAAGIAAALGTSLVMMGATLGSDRSTAAENGGDLAFAATRLGSLYERLLALADDDSAAYASVLAAYRLPQDGAAEMQARAAAIQVAMQAATDVPLRMMRECHDVLQHAALVARRVPARARIDFAIGIELLDASLRGCGMCVASNVAVLSDTDAVDRITQERQRIEAAARERLTAIRGSLTRD